MSQRMVDSRWWLLVAGVLAWAIVATGLLVTAVVFEVGGTALVVLAYGSIALLVLLPLGLYMDGTRVRDTAGAWQPDVTLYVVGGLVGVFVPLVGVLVAAVYLYRRHVHIGTP